MMDATYPNNLEEALKKIDALTDYTSAVIFSLGFQLGTFMTTEMFSDREDNASKITEALLRKIDELSPSSKEDFRGRKWHEDYLKHVETLPESNQKDHNQAFALISWYCTAHSISFSQFARESKIGGGIISQLKYGEYNMQDRIRNKLIDFFNGKGYELTIDDIYPQGVPK